MIFDLQVFEKEGLKIPVLIGGATTSKVHTAVKLDPHYSGVVAQVADASLVVEVCNKLLSPNTRAAFAEESKKRNKSMREDYLKNAEANESVSLEEARSKKFKSDWAQVDVLSPERKGVFEVPLSIEKLVEFIDWGPFFWAWELKGSFPQILKSPKYGEEAQKLYDDAQELLKRMIKENRVQPKALVGVFPAHAQDENVFVTHETFKDPLHFDRQTRKKVVNNDIYYSLADFIAPKEANRNDHLGMFVVTAGEYIDVMAKEFEKNHDDYNSILVKAVGDRLAEASAEYTHKWMRENFGIKENLTKEDLVQEKYRGIRPAPGYPACPDHSEKAKMWKLLRADERIGVTLTENFAMNPPASVSGYYFMHPDSKYFAV
jgi:5-methyltetrahydrofolate--homocysteine methyltransferase